jgi:hypothetical protein
MGESTGWEETGMAEMSNWDQANRRQKLGFGLENRKKISQIIKDYFPLPFFLIIILWQKTNSHRLKVHKHEIILNFFLT